MWRRATGSRSTRPAIRTRRPCASRPRRCGGAADGGEPRLGRRPRGRGGRSDAPAGERAAVAEAEARAIADEDAAASAALAEHGADLLAGLGVRRVLTHCNTGALAASGRGTALGVIRALGDRGPVEVLADETRPLLQGARLTAWELERSGCPSR